MLKNVLHWVIQSHSYMLIFRLSKKSRPSSINIINNMAVNMEGASPPVFEQIFRNARFAQGGNALFEGKVKGNPKPQVVWTRKGLQMKGKIIVSNECMISRYNYRFISDLIYVLFVIYRKRKASNDLR